MDLCEVETNLQSELQDIQSYLLREPVSKEKEKNSQPPMKTDFKDRRMCHGLDNTKGHLRSSNGTSYRLLAIICLWNQAPGSYFVKGLLVPKSRGYHLSS